MIILDSGPLFPTKMTALMIITRATNGRTCFRNKKTLKSPMQMQTPPDLSIMMTLTMNRFRPVLASVVRPLGTRGKLLPVQGMISGVLIKYQYHRKPLDWRRLKTHLG